MTASQAIIDYILKIENFVPFAYADGMSNGVQLYSIGYGHQLAPGESYPTGIDEATARNLFESDLAPLENQLDGYSLTQNQYDALLDFGYNCGSGALGLVLGTWSQTNDAAATTAHMSLYNKTTRNGVKVVDSDLVARRQYEVNLFNTPDTDGGSSDTYQTITVAPGQKILIVGASAVALLLGLSFLGLVRI